MSAVLKDAPRLLVMSHEDLDEVLEIENALYTHPWTRGNFSDSLRAAYDCRTWRLEGGLWGTSS
jgi:ribosomal-protein-alanine N-acetyltransferase